jgi:hypothetical protein
MLWNVAVPLLRSQHRLIRVCALLTSEPRLVRNTIAPRNLVMQAPGAQFLEDSAPSEEVKTAFPTVPWDVLRKGAHIYAFRPISSLLIWGVKPPEVVYDIAIRNMFFAHYNETSHCVG